MISSTNPAFDPNDSSTWNRVRTCLIGGNTGDGIVFAGGAHGAEVTDTAVGTNSNIKLPIPNGGNGIVVGGTANTIAIGGFEPSVERVDGGFGVHVGSSGGYGRGNTVISNRAFGLYAVGDCAGSVVLGNSFAFNGLGNEQLTRATGLLGPVVSSS